MTAPTSTAAARSGDNDFARWCAKARDVMDCAIPIALVIALAAGMASSVFGLAQ